MTTKPLGTQIGHTEELHFRSLEKQTNKKIFESINQIYFLTVISAFSFHLAT